MDEQKTLIKKKDAKNLGMKFYFTGNPCPAGHISYRYVCNGKCSSCVSQYSTSNKDRISAYHKEHNRKYGKEYRVKISEKTKIRNSNYWKLNMEKILNSSKAYYSKNKDKIKIYKRNYKKNRYENDISFCLKNRISGLIRSSLKDKGFRKESKTFEILGCSPSDFKFHIESQFLPGMTWENRREWHIDHIIPISSAKTESEIIALNHFTNLRPLWAIDNLKKGAKMEYPL